MSPQESYYAGAKWHLLKQKNYSDIINYATKKKADFLIFDKNLKESCPDFAKMAKEDGIEVFADEFEKSSRNIVIYKLKK